MFRFEIVGKTEKQGAVFGPDRLPLDNLADRTASHLSLLLAVGIGDLAILEKQLFTDQFDVIKTIILAAFFDHLRDQIENKGGMNPEAFAVTDAPV